MPERAATPEIPPRKALPANLDALVRDAMRGGGIAPLRAALEAQAPTVPRGAEVARPGSANDPAASPPTATAPHPGRAPTVDTPPTPPLSRSALLDAVVLAAERARVAIDLGAALDAVTAAVAEARALIPAGASDASALTLPLPGAWGEARSTPAPSGAPGSTAPAPTAPDPHPIPLPPVRFPWLLVVTAGGDEARIARALDVDRATARQIAHVAGPRVVGRGEDRAALEHRAGRARAEGLHATVQARSALSALPPAEALLSLDLGGACRLDPAPLWLAPPDPGNAPVGTVGHLEDVRLIVPGEVEVRDQRAPRAQDKWSRDRYATAGPVAERRVVVVDLHLPGRIVRVAEGLVDLRGDPAFVSGSARRTLLAWLEGAPRRWPAARVEARRTCPGGPAAAGEDGRLTGSGWPAWEEYSRLAWLHGAAPGG
jgi:hypothetical protein